MKFFTPEWWSGLQAGDFGDADRRYRAHIASIRDQLSPELLLLQEVVSLHDAHLLSLNVTPSERMAVMTLHLDDGRKLELRYSGLSQFDSVQTPEQALNGPGGFGDLGYDEVYALADGSFEHRILFSSSIELRFRFAALELRASDTPHPPRLASSDEGERRWAIIDASKAADAASLPTLLSLLRHDSYDNRRHIVRALGNIGGPDAESALLVVLHSEEGLLLGDAARAVGRLRITAAVDRLRKLLDHELDWVRAGAREALRRLGASA